MSDTQPATETQPKEETNTAAEVSEAAAPVAEPETTTPEEPKAEKTEEAPAATAEEKPTTEEDKPAAETEEVTPAAEAVAAEPSTEAATEGESKETAEEPAVEPEPEPEPIEIPSGNGELVLVTGATGYLASHIVKLLHESGEFKVRGTVRSLENNEKLDSLKALLRGGDDEECSVEFVEADLTKPESWTEAVKDCEYVIHAASPFPITDPANESEVIEPARDGTTAVLKACADAKTVKRVVITSSIAAIVAGRSQDKNAVNEETWADDQKSQSAYDKSKAIAERAAWDFIKEQPEDSAMELSVVNPGFITGPPLFKMDCTSVELIKKLMNREHSAVPKISFPCIDVRDVALAHVRAMMIKQAAGKRHIVCGTSCWLKDMANMLSQEFNSKGFNIPTTQAPYILVWLKAHMNPQLKRILPDVGKLHQFDTSRMTTVLQVEPRDVKTSLVEMGHAMINLEIVHKVEKPEKKPRKLTFRKKKEKKADEENEEKKDEPEKAASTSGSADNGSAAADGDAANIEDVEIKVETEAVPTTETAAAETTQEEAAVVEKAEEVTPAAAEQEAKVESAAEEDKPASDSGAVHSEEEVKADEATTADPESTKKKDKKAKKEKKEKGEKKKGGIFSFSFKKKQKPTVEKKAAEADKSDEEAAATSPTAEEQAPAEAATNEEPAAPAEAATTEETPAATTEETPAPTEESLAKEEAKEEAPAEEPSTQQAPAEQATTEQTPAEKTEAAPHTESKPAEEAPAAATETSTAE